VSPTFVGRSSSLAAADTVLRQVAGGTASHLLVSGEAGIGKTRFAGRVAEHARDGGFIVLYGGCVHLDSGEIPYAALSEALRALPGRLDRDQLSAAVGRDAVVLARLAPSLGARRSSSAAPPTGRARAQLFEGLLGLLGRLSASAPVLLVAEDLHWADSATLDALAFLLHSLRDQRVGLLLTFRSDELHRRHPLRPWLGEIVRLDGIERLELPPLVPDETRELIAAIRGEDPADGLVRRIQLRSDGNPLFIEELLGENEGDAPTAMPPSLQEIIQGRLASVPDPARAVLAAVAVAGRSVDVGQVARVSRLHAGPFDAALESGRDRGLLQLEHGARPGHVAFRHALIQEVAYDRLLPMERVRLHRAWAETLEDEASRSSRADPGRWAELAHHWAAVGDRPRTFVAALRAADEAEHAYAFAAAVAQYGRALSEWERIDDPQALAGFDHVELLARAAEAAWLSGRGGEVPLLRAAMTEADENGDPVRGALLQGRLGVALWVGGSDPIEARQALRAAVSRMPPGPPTPDRARVLAGLGQVLMLDGELRESQRISEEAVAMAAAVGDRRTEADALDSLACALTDLGRGRSAATAIERSLAIARAIGDPDLVGRAYHNATEILAICGRDRRALELAAEGTARSDATGTAIVYGAFISLHAAVVSFELGEWDRAAAFIDAGPKDAQPPATEAYALARMVGLAVARGDEAAEAMLTRMSELLPRFHTEYQQTGPYACACAELALWRASPGRAIAVIEESLGRLEQTDDTRFRVRSLRLGMRAAADLAELARDRHDAEAEAQAIATADALRLRSAPAVASSEGMDGGLALELRAEIATVAAEATRLAGSSDPVAWDHAAELWRARERPYPRAYARYRSGEARLGRGDRRGAAACLQEAAAIAERLGAHPLHREIRSLVRRARIPIQSGGEPEERPATVEAPDREDLGLTAREREVLELMAQGMTNRQIAAHLYISVYTAGVHVSRILGKLGVRSRTEAASAAYRLGLVAR
jgi:DNA-binding CsgD family transcriptional regulator